MSMMYPDEDVCSDEHYQGRMIEVIVESLVVLQLAIERDDLNTFFFVLCFHLNVTFASFQMKSSVSA
jgi:hypothetical protein